MKFILRPHDYDGSWLTKDHIYRENAHECLEHLISDVEAIKSLWPDWSINILKNARNDHFEIFEKAKSRDRNNDMAMAYSAMAIEGFINFYGVLRLGDSTFKKHIPRQPLELKLKKIVHIADELDLDSEGDLIKSLKIVAKKRNDLVHPKPQEINKDDDSVVYGELIPDAAKNSVEAMERFFEEFSRLIPKAAHHVKNLRLK